MDFDSFIELMGLLKAPWDPEQEKAELRGAFKALAATATASSRRPSSEMC